ncbi:hypothetical protein KP509_36G009400 [Ceratopteris richardii]|uniref:Uncharacterized protein n=1 Tax=Ceratopteris richardii TaxID=49495 RepID=A0A8T2QAP7_CERRI|nr:hypothetical protein KP509_36G009400 [Ceratopteris richardii]KAH7280689.1 hypothetical protein KP509_36G009400 [Ceratopteris richardii]KAH7280690.1 hypothetical protein KP509_36G009400 [Ceratopteris richardii]
MGLIKLAVADASITFLWVVYIAFMRPMADIIVGTFNLQGYEVLVVMALIACNIFLFSWLGAALEGALWNPTPVLAFYSMGVSKDSLFSMAVRYPAQVSGAIGGVLAAKELVPPLYREKLSGPQLLVDLNRGILSELILTFLITFSVLTAIFKGPKSKFLKNWIITFATILVIFLGAGYTGPGLNPAHAFAWAYIDGKHSELEHLLVYCVAPLAGSFSAALIFQLLFATGKTKEKTA